MNSPLNLLCIDSSTEACSVAVKTSQAQYQRFMLAPREHTQKILPSVEEVLKQAQLKLAQLDYIVYGQGPGSFTGVRIGISIAQGLAFGINKKMVGVSTLQAMAQQCYQDEGCGNVYAAIDARMGEVYFAHYQVDEGVMTLVDKELVIKPELLIKRAEDEESLQQPGKLVGTGWDAYPALTSCFEHSSKSAVIYPDSAYMFAAAQQNITKQVVTEADAVTPVYLRDTVTWKKLPGRE